ncbi:MAG: flagellar hook-associated protein FlgL [Janthinobacterium lividum]
MRIATSTLYNTNVDTISGQHASLVDLQGQLSTGKRINTAADDPRGAAQTVRLSQSNNKLTQYTGNLSTAKTALQLEDSTLGNVTTLIQQAQSMTVSVGNATLDYNAGSALAAKIESIRDQMLDAANATDSQGSHVFGGFETASAPFSLDAQGQGVYTGSQGQRSVQVSDGRTMPIGDVGSKLFQGVSAGAARVVAAGPGNTGSAVHGATSTSDSHDPAFGDSFAIAFKVGSDGATSYSVRNTTSNTEVLKDQPYKEGTGIKFAGQSVTVSGAPADGDALTVGSAQSAGTDLFRTLTDVANAVRGGQPGSAGNAKITNAMTTAQIKLGNALDNVLTAQASVGAREQEADTLTGQHTDTGVRYQSQMSDITGSDFVSAYSKFSQVQDSLQAAEKTFMQVQNLSLFDQIK